MFRQTVARRRELERERESRFPSNLIDSSFGGLRNDVPTFPSGSKIHESGDYDALVQPLSIVVVMSRRSDGRLSLQRQRRCWLLGLSDYASQRSMSSGSDQPGCGLPETVPNVPQAEKRESER